MLYSTFEPFGFFEVSMKTYLIVILGVGSFLLGFMLLRVRCKTSINPFYNLERLSNAIVDSRMTAIILSLICLYELRFVENALLLATIDNESTSINKFEGVFMGDRLGCWIWMYLMAPIFHSLNVLISVALVKRQRISLINIACIIAFYCMFGILSGGRILFANILYSIVMVYVILNPSFSIKRLNIKTITIFLGIGLLVFTGMLYMSAFRGHGDFTISERDFDESVNDLVEKPGRYITLPYVLLDISFKEDYLNKFGGFQMGKTSLAGGDILICGVLNRYGIKIESTENITNYLQNEWKPCAPDHSYNYAYTGILSHYLDFGIFGVILFPAIFGFLVRVFINQLYRYNSIWSLLILNLSFYLMIQAAFSNFLQNPPIFLYLSFLLLMEILSNLRYSKFFKYKSNISQ